MDIFICTEQAKETVFFDIDWNEECWDNAHTIYTALASLVLAALIPIVIYLRVKYQEVPPDLNILANPRFIAIKTSIITLMIIFSKVL